MDKTLILNKIIAYKRFKSDAEFARFLEITPQNLSKWKQRNTYDVELLCTKYPELNPEWLLTGKEPMLKEIDKSINKNNNDKEDIIMDLQNQIKDKDQQIGKLIHTLSILTKKIEDNKFI